MSISAASNCVGFRRTVDLLPWADPYIAQLFAEAGMLAGDAACEIGEAESRTNSSGRRRLAEVVAIDELSGQDAIVEAVFTRHAWHLAPAPHRRSVARTRRPEAEPTLARC